MSHNNSYSLRNRRVERRNSGKTNDSEQPNMEGAAGDDNVNGIIATLNALRTSVEELRQSTTESQRDIIRLREGMQSQTASQENVQPAQEASQLVVADTDSRLKLYDLPTFSGNIDEWPLFFANFKDTTDTFRYSHRQNLMRLQKCLVGPAKEAVASMLIYPNDVPNVLNELEFRFGRPDILVRHQINQLQQLPPILDSKIEKIVSFSSKVRNVVAFLKSAKCQQHLANITLLEQMVSKLPQARQFDWAKYAAGIQPYPTIEHFSVWLSELARIISLMPTITTQSNRQNAQPNNTRRLMHIDRVKENGTCYKCGGKHTMSQCGSFKTMSVDDRWELVKSQQLCFSCLRKGHGTSKCRSKQRCEANGCRRYHHQLLHNGDAAIETPSRITTENGVVQPLLNCRVKQPTQDLLFKMLPVNVYGPHGKREIIAMFDEGSSISIMEAEVADTIGAKGHLKPLTLQWYDNKVVTEQACKINIEIENSTNKRKFALKDVYTVKNLNLPEQSFRKENFEHMKDLPISNYNFKKPAMLIGLKHAYLGAATTIVQCDNDSPLAAKTPLGWVAFGPTKSPAASNPRVLHLREYQQLHDLVSEYLTADTFGTNPSATKLESEEERQARLILEQTTKRLEKQYEVGLLWKVCPPNLPNSRPMAEKRLLAVERKMRDDVEFCTRYAQEIANYLNKGYARKLSRAEINTQLPRVWYLPHFAVLNPQKPEKMRIVFDAAASVGDVSLNSALVRGPEQAQPLIRILLQFRQGRIGVSADIREMFSQIKVRLADQHVQRFLWRDGDPNRPIEEYAMTSLIFGAVCSPCIAEYIKNKNADEFRAQYPEAAAAIINNHYVDDLVASFEEADQATRVCQQVVKIHRQAGFELRNFISNNAEVQDGLNQYTSACRETVSMERNATTDKVLGLFWNTGEDSFEFHTRFHRVPQEVLDRTRAPTKRELLRIAMAVFDPYGMLANFLIFTKLLMQETWKQEIGWDEVLPAELGQKWSSWWQEFPNIKRFKISRCYSPYMRSVGKVEVHMFVDASQIAFAAVGYVRVIHEYDTGVSFIMGKTRTAPTKLMSIPRLELQAAVLGMRLFKMIEEYLEANIVRTIFWTDSQTVLQWVYSSQRRYKAFVGHRIAEILASTSPDQWRWVPTDQNPADAGTRPSCPPRFDANSHGIKGPDFLKHHERYWPILTVQTEAILPEEIKNNTMLLIQCNSTLINFSRFSSFSKLRRTMAWVLRAAALLRKRFIKNNKSTMSLSTSEINVAEIMICRLVQKECYSAEIDELSTSGKVSKQSSLYKLSPYIDESGVLRLSGRIDEATYLPMQARRTVLLPPKHAVSALIVKHVHEKNHHQNLAITINTVRQMYWIPNVKQLLKAIQQKCTTCMLDNVKPQPPLMGQLPADRVTPFIRPFSYTGVDLFGPFNATIGRRREKRWGVIFTCLTVRAAHIELAENMSSDSFILCLRNFINRRGTPVRIRSDNGTNFIGAQKELKASEQLLDTDSIRSEADKHNIEWVFNCPMNPSAGGCWERLIRIVKSLLNKTLKEVAPRVATLQSVLIEAENIINSRPLTDLPVSHENDEPLTPNHFLLGCVNSTQTPHPVDEKICLRKQWRIALKDRVWKRWVVEYLPQLLRRTKWQEKTTPLQVNDLVIICDPSLPRVQWQRGRITKVFPAKDGQVRVAEVQTSSGIFRRPASRLARLIVNGESQEDSRGAGC